MGVYFRGMEMPDSCTECLACKRDTNFTDDGMWYYIYNCWLKPDEIEDGWIRFREADKGRQQWCPITEVKEPHGRLKDVDALKYSWTLIHDEEQGYRHVDYSSKEWIDQAPTVIEAEGDEECGRLYEMQCAERDYCERYEPTYNPEDGSM